MSDADDLRRDRILAARRDKKQAADMRVMSLQASTMMGGLQGKVLFLTGKVAQLEELVAKLTKRLERLERRTGDD